MITTSNQTPHGTILIVDDNMSNLKSLTDILKFTGYEVQTATDGPRALRMIGDRSPELILLDYKMAGMNGIEVCRHVKSDPRTAGIPIIFLSGHGDTDLKVEAMEAGGIDYVTKPIQPAELLVKIENHLKIYRLQKRLAIQSQELRLEVEERRQAEEGLRNSEIFLSSIIEQTPFATCITDAQGTGIRYNSAYQKLFGGGVDTMEERSYNLLHDSNLREHNRVIRRVYQEGKTGRFQVSFGHSPLYEPGTPQAPDKTVEITIFPIKDDAGRVTNAIAQYNDITLKKNMEEQLFINEKLATIAGLAAGVAHEINTPLSAILQSQQLLAMGLSADSASSLDKAATHGIDLRALQDYLKDNELDFFLEGIHKSALSATHIVQSLLEFSRPRRGSFAVTDLATLLDKALLLARSDYDMKKRYHIIDIEIEREYAQEPISINCVAVEIEQVILNLLKNSAASLAESGFQDKPCIVLRSAQNGEKVTIEVEDNGPGIPEEVKQHIFDPFFTTRDLGTGLGLSISHGIIVDRHKGQICLQSKPGQGAKFIVELPVNAGDS